MKKILFVEDDALIARIYSQKLAEEGFEVVVAVDGLEAMKRLPGYKPDLVVLDLLMPKMTGADVLKYMRQHEDLKSIRVVVFSNSFLSNLLGHAGTMEVEEILFKTSATPARLVELIHKVLERPSRAAAALASDSSKPQAPAGAGAKPAPVGSNKSDSEFRTRVRREFLERTPAIFKSTRQVCRDFLEAADSLTQSRRLEDLNRKIGFLTQMTAMAGYSRIAELSSALEALLFELRTQPAFINDSCRHTIASTVAFLADCMDRAELADEPDLLPPEILVVDDDIVSNRALVLALARAKLSATSETDPFAALKRLQQTTYNLVFLDINMPGKDGLALCEQMRSLPQHKHTPVIFFTGRTDFKTRARSILSGGNDLITKPILPVELCVKAMTYLLKAGCRAEV